MSYDLAGRVVLITGGARGIGAEAARQLVARGAKVALVGLEPSELERRAGELGADNAVWFEADVTDANALRAAAQGTVERFGGIDVAIANAGIATATPLVDGDSDVFETIVRVNLLGSQLTVAATLPHIMERRGYFLQIASLAAGLHAPMMGAYSATKAGVEAMANSLRPEVAGSGVKVGVAYFGFIDTDMVQRGFSTPAGRGFAQKMGPLGPDHAIPVERAGAAIVAGIERRARQICAPRRVRALLLARTILQPLSEKGAAARGLDDLAAQARTEPAVLTTEQPGSPAPR